MRNVWRLAVNDLRLMFKDRTSWIWLAVMPIALIWVFGQLGGPPTDVPRISMAVDDRDGGWLARELVGELAGDQVALTDLAALAPEETPPNRVRTLVIPEGFTEAVLRGEKQQVRLEAEPGSSTDFGFAAQVHSLRAIGRLLARLAEMRVAEGGGEEGDQTTLQAAFKALGERKKLVTLEVSSAGGGRPVPSGRAQSVPGMLTMMVMMMTLIYGAVMLTVEKREGMLRRQSAMPLSRIQIFSGKLLGRFLVALVQAAILLAAGRFLFGIRFGDSPVALALLLGATCFSAAGLATLLGALVSTPEQAESIGWISSIVLGAIGGCWWPSEVMPRWLWSAAHVLPTAWAMDGFHALISFGRGLDGVWIPSLVLVGFGVVSALLGARFLRFE